MGQLVIAILLAVMPAHATMSASQPHFAWQRHAVTTSNVLAQALFDEGMTYLYAYNRPAAQRAFAAAAKVDPKLAMAHWGVAIALGSNINVHVSPKEEKQAYREVQKAM